PPRRWLEALSKRQDFRSSAATLRSTWRRPASRCSAKISTPTVRLPISTRRSSSSSAYRPMAGRWASSAPRSCGPLRTWLARSRRRGRPHPEFRLGLRQPAALSDRPDRSGEARGVVDLDADTRNGSLAERRLKPAVGNFGEEARKGFFLVHAKHRVVIAAHADIADIGSTPVEDLLVCRGHVGVGADHRARAPVDEKAHRLLLRGGLGMEIDEARVGAAFEAASLDLAVDGAEGVVQVAHEHSTHGVDHEHVGAVRRLEQAGTVSW